MSFVRVIDRKGALHEIPADPDDAWSLMSIMKEHDLDVEGACGGCISCATCHIYVSEAWLDKLEEKTDDEAALLENCAEYQEKYSRLSCQIEFVSELEGIEVTLAPEE